MNTSTAAKTTRPTEEQQAEWKKKFKAIHEITTQDEKYSAIVRQPNMMDMEAALDKGRKKGARTLDFNRALYRSCLLWVHPGLAEDDDMVEYQIELAVAMGEIGDFKEATIKKL